MEAQKHGWWAALIGNIRTRMISGVLLLVPFGVTLLVMRWLFQALRDVLMPIVREVPSPGFLHAAPPAYTTMFVSAVIILVLLAALYLIGAVGRFVLGRKLISAGETLLLQIPLVRTIYSATKQVMQAISLPDRTAFKSVVLVEFPRPGIFALGFLTGYLDLASRGRHAKVFIPTAPNPTTGFFEIVPAAEIQDTGLPIEEGFKIIMSGGIIAPETLHPTGGTRRGPAPPPA